MNNKVLKLITVFIVLVIFSFSYSTVSASDDINNNKMENFLPHCERSSYSIINIHNKQYFNLKENLPVWGGYSVKVVNSATKRYSLPLSRMGVTFLHLRKNSGYKSSKMKYCLPVPPIKHSDGKYYSESISFSDSKNMNVYSNLNLYENPVYTITDIKENNINFFVIFSYTPVVRKNDTLRAGLKNVESLDNIKEGDIIGGIVWISSLKDVSNKEKFIAFKNLQELISVNECENLENRINISLSSPSYTYSREPQGGIEGEVSTSFLTTIGGETFWTTLNILKLPNANSALNLYNKLKYENSVDIEKFDKSSFKVKEKYDSEGLKMEYQLVGGTGSYITKVSVELKSDNNINVPKSSIMSGMKEIITENISIPEDTESWDTERNLLFYIIFAVVVVFLLVLYFKKHESNKEKLMELFIPDLPHMREKRKKIWVGDELEEHISDWISKLEPLGIESVRYILNYNAAIIINNIRFKRKENARAFFGEYIRRNFDNPKETEFGNDDLDTVVYQEYMTDDKYKYIRYTLCLSGQHVVSISSVFRSSSDKRIRKYHRDVRLLLERISF